MYKLYEINYGIVKILLIQHIFNSLESNYEKSHKNNFKKTYKILSFNKNLRLKGNERVKNCII